MAIDDLWYLRTRDPQTGQRLPSKRHGEGQRWRVRYLDDSGAKATRAFEKKVDAERFDAGVRTDVERGLYVDPAVGRLPLRDYAEQWRTAQLHRDSTSGLIEQSFRLHINPVLGQLPIGRIRSTHVQRLVKNMDLAPSSVRLVFSHLAAMFATAVRDRAIGGNPCVGVRLPELPTSEYLILTPDQVHRLAKALPSEQSASVYVGAGCGLRPSEMLGLELEHVDFLRREITVSQQLRTSVGKPPFLAPPKTKTSYRTIELPKVTANALARHLEVHPVVPVLVDDLTNPRKPIQRPASLIFTSGGKPISRSMWTKLWAPAARSIGLDSGTGFHTLRHYFATVLIFSGANVKTVQTALGHSSPTITLNSYVGLWPDQLDRTRNLMDAALGEDIAEGVDAQ